jgi:hypothetical protein
VAAHLRTRSPHRRIAQSPSSSLAWLSLAVGLVICGAGGRIINPLIAVAVAQSQSGLAANYPGDVGIETDPNVVFVEKFEETTTTNLFARWTDVLNAASMSLSTDVVPGSVAGSHSLNISSIGGGGSDGGHLYRQLTPGVDDTLYVRYYIKYPTGVNYSHQGIWMGGHNPPVSWPDPQAGIKPVGNDRFSAAAEQIAGTAISDHYDYWMNMRMATDGNYWGNRLLNDATVRGVEGQWMCVEQMVKLNNPVTAFNGEHAIWLNGVKISHLGPGFPNGTWLGGNFTQTPLGTPFEGFRWRSDPSLNLNWIWLQNYSPNDPMGINGSMKFDHVVAAKSYIGCLASGSPTSRPPAAPTNVRIVVNGTPAPVAQVTVAPASASVASGATKQLTATLRDASGNVLTGRTVSWGSSNLSGATVSATGLVTGVAPGSATVTATSEGKTGTAAVTITGGSGSGSWPNEPSGFVQLSDQPWNVVIGNGWNYLRRTGSLDDNIVLDPAAPLSPQEVLRINFTPGMQRDSEPGVHWVSLPNVAEVYTGWWIKLSPNWQSSPAGGGKITFLWTSGGQGQVYTGFFGSTAPHHLSVNTEWAPYGQKIWDPNVTTTPINYDQWYRIEWYVKWETSPGAGNGVMKWWVNGALNGNYSNVVFPSGSSSFNQFEFAPTLQNPPTATQYMYIDHTRVSRR